MTNNHRSQAILEKHQTPRMLKKEEKFYALCAIGTIAVIFITYAILILK